MHRHRVDATMGNDYWMMTMTTKLLMMRRYRRSSISILSQLVSGCDIVASESIVRTDDSYTRTDRMLSKHSRLQEGHRQICATAMCLNAHVDQHVHVTLLHSTRDVQSWSCCAVERSIQPDCTPFSRQQEMHQLECLMRMEKSKELLAQQTMNLLRLIHSLTLQQQVA